MSVPSAGGTARREAAVGPYHLNNFNFGLSSDDWIIWNAEDLAGISEIWMSDDLGGL